MDLPETPPKASEGSSAGAVEAAASPTPLPGNWARWLAPRPAEWVVLAFLGYLGLRGVVLGRVLVDLQDRLPAFHILAVVVVIVVVRLVLEYRRAPWPEDAWEVGRLHLLLLPFLAAPAAYVLMHDLFLADSWWFDRNAVGKMRGLLWVFERFSVAGPPLWIPWLTVGLYIKRGGRMRPVAFIRENAIRLADWLRDWTPLLVVIFAYGAMGTMLELESVSDKDAALQRIDKAIFFGHDPVHALEAVISRPLNEWLSFSYSFYAFLFPICFGAIYATGKRTAFREVAFATSLTMAAGYVGYSLVPAAGPVFTETFRVSLDAYYLKPVQEALMERWRIQKDCFPSLHTAMTLVFLWACWRHTRRLFWVLIPIGASIPFACVYLRYHWVVDIFAGIALWAITTTLSPRVAAAYEKWLVKT